METQPSRFREHLPRGRTASGSAPGPGAQRTQRSVGSLKRRRWGALHVRIAWKIYHHKQLKRIQQKCIGGRAGVAPERPSNLQPGPKSEDEAGAPLDPPSPPRPKRKRLRWRDRRTGKELPGDTGVTSDPDSPGGRDPLGRGGLSDSSWSSRTPGPRAHAARCPHPCIRAGHAQGSRRRFVPLPGVRTPLSWGSMWDICQSSGWRMETLHLRRREALNVWMHHLAPPGFLEPSYPGPGKSLLP